MEKYNRTEEIVRLQQDWAKNLRWRGIQRNYIAEDVVSGFEAR